MNNHRPVNDISPPKLLYDSGSSVNFADGHSDFANIVEVFAMRIKDLYSVVLPVTDPYTLLPI